MAPIQRQLVVVVAGRRRRVWPCRGVGGSVDLDVVVEVRALVVAQVVPVLELLGAPHALKARVDAALEPQVAHQVALVVVETAAPVARKRRPQPPDLRQRRHQRRRQRLHRLQTVPQHRTWRTKSRVLNCLEIKNDF